MGNKQKVRCLVKFGGQYYPVMGRINGLDDNVVEVEYKFMGKKCMSTMSATYEPPVIGGVACYPVAAGRLSPGVFDGNISIAEAPLKKYLDRKIHNGMMESVKGKEQLSEMLVKWLVIAGLGILAFVVFQMNDKVSRIDEKLPEITATETVAPDYVPDYLGQNGQ